MVPQPRQSKPQCSPIPARTPAQLSQAAPLERDHNNFKTPEDVTAFPSEHGGQRSTTSAITQVERPQDGRGLVSVGLRPLMLGTFKVVTPSPSTVSKSQCARRPSSSFTQIPRTPTVPSTRCWSYTSPISPHSPPSPSPVSEEVEILKTQLAASEALVQLLIKERFRAVSASRRMFSDIKKLQKQQIEWEKEKEDLLAKLISRQEEEATQVVSPPSEEVWFAGSSKERWSLPKEHSSHFSPTHLSQHDGNLETLPAEELPIPEIIVTPPTDSDVHSEPGVNKGSKRSPGPSAGGETAIVYLSPTSYLSSRSTRGAQSRSRQRGKAFNDSPIIQRATPPSLISPWASGPSRRALLDALALPSPVSPWASTTSRRALLDALEPPSLPSSRHSVAPQPTRSVSRPPPQLDLNDLVSQTVGKEILPRSPERRVLHDRSKLPRASGDGPAGRGHSTNPATGPEPPASMIGAPISTRPGDAPSESPNWLASHGPQIDLSLLRRFAGEAATVESRSRRPSAPRMLIPSSSPREEAGDSKHQNRSRLRKLLNKGRSVISHIV